MRRTGREAGRGSRHAAAYLRSSARLPSVSLALADLAAAAWMAACSPLAEPNLRSATASTSSLLYLQGGREAGLKERSAGFWEGTGNRRCRGRQQGQMKLAKKAAFLQPQPSRLDWRCVVEDRIGVADVVQVLLGRPAKEGGRG